MSFLFGKKQTVQALAEVLEERMFIFLLDTAPIEILINSLLII